MAITPQAIKDQEFQVKLRGYDTVEVKAYLELIAEEFFELLEQVRQQVDDLDVIVEERDALRSERDSLHNELASIRNSSEEIRSESAQRDNRLVALQDEIAKLKTDIVTLETHNSGKDQDLAAAETRIKKSLDALEVEKERNDKLTKRLQGLEKQNEELRSEELSFKSTLVAAQQFTTDLKKKSEQEAVEIVDQARVDAEQIRQDTVAELANYPAEIKRLKNLRNTVREDLEGLLRSALQKLEAFKESEGEKDLGELYQKAQGAGATPEIIEETVDLESLDMNFDLSETNEFEEGETFSMKDDNASEDFP